MPWLAIGSLAQYIYMTHYFANPLSILDGAHLQTEHLEAVRNLPSLRRYVDKLLDEKRLAEVKTLLADDLSPWVHGLLRSSRVSMSQLLDGLQLFHKMQHHLSPKIALPWSSVYLQGLSGELVHHVTELLMLVRKLPSDAMCQLLHLLHIDLPDLGAHLQSLRSLMERVDDTTGPLRGENDMDSVVTAVIARRVQLQKQKRERSEQDEAYSTIVSAIALDLDRHLGSCLIDPKELPLHEVFLFDQRFLGDVFAPRPLPVIDRALSHPHDYLGCDCCDSTDMLSRTQPATAILYQLLLESGAVINTADLWSAFQAIVGDATGDATGDAAEDANADATAETHV